VGSTPTGAHGQVSRQPANSGNLLRDKTKSKNENMFAAERPVLFIHARRR